MLASGVEVTVANTFVPGDGPILVMTVLYVFMPVLCVVMTVLYVVMTVLSVVMTVLCVVTTVLHLVMTVLYDICSTAAWRSSLLTPSYKVTSLSPAERRGNVLNISEGTTCTNFNYLGGETFTWNPPRITIGP